jgi:TRAP-type C4-dicarboxylate transport system permease small subunit
MVERRGEQMVVDSFLQQLGSRARAGIEFVHALLGIGFLAVLTVAGTQVVATSIRLGKMNPGSLEYPVAVSQVAVPIGGMLLGMELLLRVGRLVQALRKAT